MSLNSLSSSAVDLSARAVALNGAEANRGIETGQSNRAAQRPDANESARAAEATAQAIAKASENAQVLRFDSDNQVNNGNQGKVVDLNEAKDKPAEPTAQQLNQALEVTNRLSTLQVRSLEFTSSQEDGRTIVKVVDRENDEVIRQIPSEEFVKMAERVSELSQQLDSAQGLLFESQV